MLMIMIQKKMISRNGRKLRIFSSAFPSLFPSLCFRAPRPIRRRPRVIFNPAPRRRPLQAIRLPPRLTSRPVRSPRELLARPTARKRAPSSRRKCPVPAACIINSIKMTTRAMVHASYKSNYWLIAWKVDFGADEMMLTMDMVITSYSGGSAGQKEKLESEVLTIPIGSGNRYDVPGRWS